MANHRISIMNRLRQGVVARNSDSAAKSASANLQAYLHQRAAELGVPRQQVSMQVGLNETGHLEVQLWGPGNVAYPMETQELILALVGAPIPMIVAQPKVVTLVSYLEKLAASDSLITHQIKLRLLTYRDSIQASVFADGRYLRDIEWSSLVKAVM